MTARDWKWGSRKLVMGVLNTRNTLGSYYERKSVSFLHAPQT